MNRLLQEMWRQAVLDTTKTPMNFEEAAEKFANDILHRCVKIAETERMSILHNPNDPSWTEHLANVQTQIKQTFGVKT